MNRKIHKILSEEIENLAKQGNHEPYMKFYENL